HLLRLKSPTSCSNNNPDLGNFNLTPPTHTNSANSTPEVTVRKNPPLSHPESIYLRHHPRCSLLKIPNVTQPSSNCLSHKMPVFGFNTQPKLHLVLDYLHHSRLQPQRRSIPNALEKQTTNIHACRLTD
ncbi:hypothetical protein M758_3G068700, partial [Ceratodon purpureus]